MIPSLKQANTVYQSMWVRSRVVFCAYRATNSSGVARFPASINTLVSTESWPGSYQVASIQPRSSNGSPMVHISQSTIATTSGPVGENITFAAW